MANDRQGRLSGFGKDGRPVIVVDVIWKPGAHQLTFGMTEWVQSEGGRRVPMVHFCDARIRISTINFWCSGASLPHRRLN